MRRIALGALAALALVTSHALPLAAQSVRLDGSNTDSAAVVLSRILADGQYLVIDRDTVLTADVRIDRDVVIVDATVRLEGRLEGTVALIDADLFVRAGGVVEGPVVTIGISGLFPSTRAMVGERLDLDRRLRTALRREGDLYVLHIVEPPPPPTLRLPPFFGFGLPEYDRVNGLSLWWGVEARFGGRDTARVTATATAGYRVGRRSVHGLAEIRYRPARRSLLTLRGGRTTRTNEGWIRGGLENSLAAIGVASDMRDYHDSDEISVSIARTTPGPLIQGERFFAPQLTLRLSRDSSVEALQPWSLLGEDDDWRENPPIDDGVVASVTGGAVFGWRGTTSMLGGMVATEWAPPGIGDFTFAQLTTAWDLAFQAIRDHQVEMRALALVPIGGDEAPLQRWSFVGGPGTLPTFDAASMRGDHVVFIRSRYLIPLNRIQIPLLGPPALRLEHAAGTAWRSGDPIPRLEQNLGIGVEVALFSATLFVDPVERPRSATLSLGARLPGSDRLPIF